MKRALISVYDKTGIIDFAKELSALGWEIVSTGGTYSLLAESGINNLVNIEDVTGFPEMLDGRVKTLHPKIHGGILAMRENPEHMRQITQQGIIPINIVVNNLYPFKQTIQKESVTLAEAIENVDIGGPSMLRAAAKNYPDVTVIIDPNDYASITDELKQNGKVSPETNFRLASKVFMHTAHYDALIAGYLGEKAGEGSFPELATYTFERVREYDMRYGENPHQSAAFYREAITRKSDITEITRLHGNALSFNNINDTHGALELLKEFTAPAAVACKHSNPCGVGIGASVSEAFRKAFEADPVSIYGGIITLNREVDTETALLMSKILLDIVLAPSFSVEALEILTKKKNTRLLVLPGLTSGQNKTALDFKKVSGGLLVQNTDAELLTGEIKTVTKRTPSEKEMEDLLFAWKIVKHTKSNAIAIGKDGQSIGIGCGQVNRIWACNQAIEHAETALGKASLAGAALASDAYFPFPDCVEAAAAAGITAIIQPGGSIRDKESIDACDANSIAMLFTGMRHFRH